MYNTKSSSKTHKNVKEVRGTPSKALHYTQKTHIHTDKCLVHLHDHAHMTLRQPENMRNVSLCLSVRTTVSSSGSTDHHGNLTHNQDRAHKNIPGVTWVSCEASLLHHVHHFTPILPASHADKMQNTWRPSPPSAAAARPTADGMSHHWHRVFFLNTILQLLSHYYSISWLHAALLDELWNRCTHECKANKFMFWRHSSS